MRTYTRLRTLTVASAAAMALGLAACDTGLDNGFDDPVDTPDDGFEEPVDDLDDDGLDG